MQHFHNYWLRDDRSSLGTGGCCYRRVASIAFFRRDIAWRGYEYGWSAGRIAAQASWLPLSTLRERTSEGKGCLYHIFLLTCVWNDWVVGSRSGKLGSRIFIEVESGPKM